MQARPRRETILVVGGAGYIGAHMVRALRRAGRSVVVLDDLSRGHREMIGEAATAPSVARGPRLDPIGDTPFVQGDLGDRAVLDEIFAHRDVAAVMHFAAWSLVGESVEKPLDYYRNNVARTVELLDAMRAHGVNCFIFSSTAAVYGEPERTPISESHPCHPTNPYGATKLAVERMLADCAAAHDLRYVSLRYFNAAGADPAGDIGERHDPETHLIPLALEVAAGRRDAICVFGADYPTPDGTCLRDYVHVNDLAAAHLLALDRLLDGGAGAIYNLGNSRGYSVREVLETARAITGHAIPAIESPRRPGDPAVLVADSTKARRELGWKPEFEDLRSIIETAWAWHRRG